MKNKPVTIADIASLAKVSKTTVSRYLNKKYEFMSSQTKEKIANIIRQYDYTPSNVARSLKTKSTKLIAFVVSDIENAFAAPVIKSMNQELLNTKFHMIVCSSDNDEEKELHVIESLIEQRVEAVFLNPVSYNSQSVQKLSRKVPIILIDRGIHNSNFDIVASDSKGSMDELLKHLIGSGYKNIHLFTQEYFDVEPRINRVTVFKEKLIKNQINEVNVDEYIHIVDPFKIKEIENKILDILSKSNLPPAIIATNGKTLLNVALAIKNLGLKMPQEIGLSGYDDFGANSANGWTNICQTPITSLCPNWQVLGQEAIKLLLKRLENLSEDPINVTTPITLIIKDSTKL